jgi:hypothetical protein
MFQALKNILKKVIPGRALKFYHYYRYPLHRELKMTFGEHYIYCGDEGSDLVYRLLSQNKPCLIARFGWLELETLIAYLRCCQEKRVSFSADLKNKMCVNAGFFPPDDSKLARFSYELLKIFPETDILGVTNNRGDEEIVAKYASDIKLVETSCIGDNVALQSNPWTRYFKGKKVLVIHPFEKSIRQQYPKRHLLFNRVEVLPEFELITLRPVQSAGNASRELPYADWFEALDEMCGQIQKIDFEIALIGAGAYGFFLGAFCKKLGKQAIHIGGALQLLFGIKGSRWEKQYPPEFGERLFNKHWIYPAQEERPIGAEKIEGACYW